MAYCVAYLAVLYKIPLELVVNTNYLVPTGGSRTWKKRGAKDIKVLRIEDKGQITAAVSSAASGELLPLQVIFTGTTQRCLPKPSIGKSDCLFVGFHLTYSNTYLSTLETCQ